MRSDPTPSLTLTLSRPGEDSALILTSQILSGLAALHAADIAHCDLKLENVLLHESVEKTLQLLQRFCLRVRVRLRLRIWKTSVEPSPRRETRRFDTEA